MKKEAEIQKMENGNIYTQEELLIKAINKLNIKRIQKDRELCVIKLQLAELEQTYREILHQKAEKMSGMKGVK